MIVHILYVKKIIFIVIAMMSNFIFIGKLVMILLMLQKHSEYNNFKVFI